MPFESLEGCEDFELLRVLGRGAFATVFVARQRSMQRLVALKISDATGREPQTMARLEHQNIVHVHDHRELAGRGLRLLYMEYVQGGSLADVIERVGRTPKSERGPQTLFESIDARLESSPVDLSARRRMERLDWGAVVAEIGAQLAEALDHAHRRGVLHLDVKPANVLLTESGQPKLVDFNISSCDERIGVEAQPFGGSLAYMSPEHLAAYISKRSEDALRLDGRSDLYALAVTLWELLHGTRPFAEPKSIGPQSRLEHRRWWLETWDAEHEASATELERVLRRCLSFDRTERYESGSEMATALRMAVHGPLGQLMGSPHGLGAWILAHPIVTGVLFAAVPNALAAVFNFAYNRREIVAQVQGAFDAFMQIQTVINVISFTVGLTAFALRILPVARALELARRRRARFSELGRARSRVLRLGHDAALIGLALWALAGVAYPLSLHWAVGAFPLQGYVHFALSLLLCGAIAAAYPALLQQWVSIRLYYPTLLGGNPSRADRPELEAFGRGSGAYLLMAGGVPTAALTMLVLYGSDNALSLSLLGGVGMVGFWGAFEIYRRIQRHVAVLIDAPRM